MAEPLVDDFAAALRELGAHVETGVFGADMQVELVNDGPVTVLLELNAVDDRRERSRGASDGWCAM